MADVTAPAIRRVVVPDFGTFQLKSFHALSHSEKNAICNKLSPDSVASGALRGPGSSPKSPCPRPAGTCSKCPGFSYLTTDEFKTHRRSDWHVENEKRSVDSRDLFTSDEYAIWLEAGSGDSASDDFVDDPQTSADSTAVQLLGAPFVPTDAGSEMLVVKPMLPLMGILLDDESQVVVLLLRSGRFAGAVWTDGGASLLRHTTFRRYTVRRKQGGAQSAHDEGSNRPARSVGANIRRQQEKKMQEDLENLITVQWKEILEYPKSVILVQCSKLQRSQLLLNPLKDNPRVVFIPMTVHTPSFAEASRVKDTLCRVAFRCETTV